MNTRKLWLIVALAIAAVGGIWGVYSLTGTTGEGQEPAGNGAEVVRPRGNRGKPNTVRPKKTPATRTSTAKNAKPVLDIAEDDDDDQRTPAEKALADRIERALDDEKLEDAIACVEEALKCSNVEIRQAMVDTLGWFGVKAMPELTRFLADEDEDVRDSAQNEWSMALSDIEDDKDKVSAVEMAMSALTNEDMLEDISGEYIGIDEKLAVESLLRIIEGNGCKEGQDKARETYEFVTGESFTDRAAAEKWLKEEYQPSDTE